MDILFLLIRLQYNLLVPLIFQLETAVLKFSLNENTELGVNTAGNGNKTNKLITVFAVNYNVLRIMSGMAGLAFVN